MGVILEILNIKKNKADKTDMLYRQGIRFESAKDKHLRLYYESQFNTDIEEDDLEYLQHIFEQKTYSLFGSHYSIINYINTDSFLKDTYEKLVDTNYKESKDIKITHKFLDNQEMTTHIFNYKIITYEEIEYKICRVNYYAEKNHDIGENINISPKILENIKTTNEIQIYNFLSDDTSLIYFVLKLVFEKYSKSVKKLNIYQIGLKTIDESLFTFVASYLRKNPNIECFSLCGRSIGQFHHLKKKLEDDPIIDDRNEKMAQEIHNMQHIFNLYQVLIKKTNLIELRLILFLNHYNFCMLGLVLQNNTNLKVLEVRNMINKDRDNDLDYTFKEMNELGENIRDEIFIFFNYLFAEDNITELTLTHFNFFSEINFMAVQAAKTMKDLDILNLESNVGLVNNDDVMANAYNLSFLPMTQLNMGMTYFRMIRNWDSLVNPFKLQFLDAGVCDFTSFASLCRYLEYCHCEKVIVRLNKPVILESIPVLFDIISGAPMRSKYLKYFYVLNAYDQDVKEDSEYKNKYLPRLFNCLRYNKVMRKLSFAKPSKNYYEIKDDEDDDGFHTFKYIKKSDYNSVIFLMKAMRKLLGYKENKEKVDSLIRNIIMYRFSTYRKFITG
jgi:hypothetical protein